MLTRIFSCAILATILFSCKSKDEISPWIQLTFKNEDGIELQHQLIHLIQNQDCAPYANVQTDQAGHIVFDRDQDLAAYYYSGAHFGYREFTPDERTDMIHEAITVYPRQPITLHVVDTIPNHYIEWVQWAEQPTCVDSLNMNPRVYVDSVNRWATPIDTTLFFYTFPCETLLEWEVRNATDGIVNSISITFDVTTTDNVFQLGPF
jgi:hypothetical protein